NLYLIVKEAINNAIKYSNCNTLVVQMKTVNKYFEVRVTDDGVGFDMERLDEKEKMGLKGNGFSNMKVRANDLKGELSVISKEGEGTSIAILIDYENPRKFNKKENF